jgi:hypothetical protein
MNHPAPDLLESLRADWQQTKAPSLSIEGVRKRLRRRRWLLLLDAVALVGVGVLMVWSTAWMDGWMTWLYWGFFAGVYVVGLIVSLRLHLQAIGRVDDSVAAVLDHARRDARWYIQGGRFGFRVSVAVLIFIWLWMPAAGWLAEGSITDFLGARTLVLVLATVWCTLGMAVSAWFGERGRRRLLETERLAEELVE